MEFRKAKHLRETVTELQAELEAEKALNRKEIAVLRVKLSEAQAAHLNDVAYISDKRDEIKALRDRAVQDSSEMRELAEECAHLRGQVTATYHDAECWRSLRPVGKWVKTTTNADSSGDELYVYQPAGGQFSEGQPYTARILSIKKGLFTSEEERTTSDASKEE